MRTDYDKKKARFSLNVLICILILLLGSVVIVQADEPSYIYIDVWYSNNLKAQQGDNFVIHYTNMDTQEEKEITIDASKLESNTGKLELPIGKYKINDITYDGYNTDIEKSGYGVTSSFVVESGENAFDEFIISIGYKQTKNLESQYESYILKQNFSKVDTLAKPGENANKATENDTGNSTNNVGEEETTKQPAKEKKQTVQKQPKRAKQEQKIEKKETTKTKSSPVKIIPLLIMAVVSFGGIYIGHKMGKF